MGPLVRGVHVHSNSSAHLSSLSVSSRHAVGVCVATHASATMVDSNVSDTVSACVRIMGGGTGQLNRCTVSGCSWGPGLGVIGVGSSAVATKRRFILNRSGAIAISGSTLTALACTSVGCRSIGFDVQLNGCIMELKDCASN